MSQIVAYYRVSTKKQGESGLGLEAQRDAVTTFAKAEGFNVVSEFTEVEFGEGSRRARQAPAAQRRRWPWPRSTRPGRRREARPAVRDVHFISA